ncbi:MAG: hypothetical protein JWL64_2216, partial [Frankiales bacterium]|nr:hypothetical protein [Frankiales bacterium]
MNAAPPDEWDAATVGLLLLRPDGTALRANDTLLSWIGKSRDDVVDRVRLSQLLPVGGRIYWETHLEPLLRVEGRFDEVAAELLVPGGRMPVLLSARTSPAEGVIRVAVSSARERSRYERELLHARRAAERSAAQVQALQRVTAALSEASDVAAVSRSVLEATVAGRPSRSAALWLGHELELTLFHATEGAELSLPAAEVLRAHETVVEGRTHTVPLRGMTALRGVLRLTLDDDQEHSPLSADMLTTMGKQAGLALDRARLHEQSAQVAHELQQSLLAVTPPADERYGVATVYRPGVEALEVGGDWYDVFSTGRGPLLSVIVGDVVGRGLPAASAMGQLRSAVRALAEREGGPAPLLSQLDRFVDHVAAAAMATLAYAELDLTSGTLHYSCAGHPPPLLVPYRGPARFLWDGRSTPLGAFLRPRERAQATHRLDPGDQILLYTDGLFERRDRGLDEGLDLLLRAATTLRALPLEESVQALTTAMLVDEQGRDDVCVLLLTWWGEPFDIRVGADLAGLSAARHALSDWLARYELEPEQVQEIVLAASEAVANAGEHGLGRRPDEQVRLRVTVLPVEDGRDVLVTVHDTGAHPRSTSTPLAPDATGVSGSPERGRGTVIMRALMDTFEIDSAHG